MCSTLLPKQSAKDVFYTPELYRKRYKFRVLIKLDQAEELEHVTDWSGIWHDFDVIYCMQKKKKREYLGYAVVK